MAHQRRLPLRDRSRNSHGQPAHCLTRYTSGPVSSAAAAWATGQSMARGSLTLPNTSLLIVAFVVLGAGLGAALVASTHAGTEVAAPEHQGVASGALASSAQVGTALGLAVLAPLGTYRLGFLGAGVLAVAGMAASLLVSSRTERVRVGWRIRGQSMAWSVSNSAHRSYVMWGGRCGVCWS
jgi:hypothetical protein